MKNIHVLPTDKPSRLFEILQFNFVFDNQNKYSEEYKKLHSYKNKNIYITSDEEIKEGDWFIANNGVHKCIRVNNNTSCPFITLNSKGEEIGHFKTWKTKIILTTDSELIADGVQAIDDEFLEWFVKHPNCEYVKTEKFYSMSQSTYSGIEYEIIIPKEEPKQETLEEVAEKYAKGLDKYSSEDFINGVVWLQEQICTSEFIQRIRATKSDAEARRLIRGTFKE